MKKSDRVILNGKLGTLTFIDNPWNDKDGKPADLLCRVALDDAVDEKTGFPDTHGKWCRLSELEKTEIKKEKMEKLGETMITKPEVSIESYFGLDVRFCKINKVEDILQKANKDFDAETNPVKAYKLTVDTGFDEREIVTNIVHFKKEELAGKITPFILNFPAAKIRGVESKGMIFMYDSTVLITGEEIGKIVI